MEQVGFTFCHSQRNRCRKQIAAILSMMIRITVDLLGL